MCGEKFSLNRNLLGNNRRPDGLAVLFLPRVLGVLEQENNHELRSEHFAPESEPFPPQRPPNKGAVERPGGTVSGEPASSPVGAQPQVGGEAGISLNRAATEAGRELRGLPEARQVLRREFGEAAKISGKNEVADERQRRLSPVRLPSLARARGMGRLRVSNCLECFHWCLSAFRCEISDRPRKLPNRAQRGGSQAASFPPDHSDFRPHSYT